MVACDETEDSKKAIAYVLDKRIVQKGDLVVLVRVLPLSIYDARLEWATGTSDCRISLFCADETVVGRQIKN